MRFTTLPFVYTIIAATCIGGCTHLDAKRIVKTTERPIAGAPYALNFTQYQVTVTRRVKSCFDKNGHPDFALATEVAIEAEEVPDPMRRYVVDLDGLQSAFKTTELSMSYYDSGALKAVNATAYDKSGEVIASVVTTAGKLLLASASGIKVAAFTPAPHCTEDTAAAVDMVKVKKKSVDDLTVVLERKTLDLEKMTAMAAAMGKAWGASERAQMKALIEEMFTERQNLAAANRELKKALKAITIETRVAWPEHGEEFKPLKPVIPALTDEELEQWADIKNDGVRDVQNKSAIWMHIESSDPAAREKACDTPTVSCAGDDARGLKYRVPVSGVLVVCSQSTCSAEDDEVIERKEGVISQLGEVYTLPLNSRMFTNRTIEATFAENGRPTRLAAKSSASAEKAASTLGSVADQYLAEKKGEKTIALEEIKAETDLLKAQKDLADTRKAMEPSAYAAQQATADAFKADTSVLDAELANLKAQQALDAARKTATP